MTTFFENPHYYSSQIKLEEPSILPSSLQQQQQQQQQPQQPQQHTNQWESDWDQDKLDHFLTELV